jgi:hypothetical protein
MPAASTYGSVSDIVAEADIVDVVYYEVAGRRRELSAGDRDVLEQPGGEPGSDDQAPSFEILLRSDDSRLEVRCRGTVVNVQGQLQVDVAVVYALPSASTVPEPLLREFAEKVGIMAVYPFLRESLVGIATKLRLPVPVLGILRQGSLTLGPPPGLDE